MEKGREQTMAVMGGILIWMFVGTWLFLVRPKSSFHRASAIQLTGKRKLILVILLGMIILLLGFLMTLCPLWNGEIPAQRDQYEMITEAFLEGRLDFGYEPDPKLLAMENPYDAELRKALGVSFHYDHAFFQGKYYMYFGVVPVFLAFMPYRLLSGHALVTWQATFLFDAVFVIGLALYLYWLMKKFFPKMPWSAFLSLLTVFSLVSTVYDAMFPALYQTPMACGKMLEIWSLYFLSKAFCREDGEDFSLKLAIPGTLLGALTFGCRPPLAVANMLVIPLAVQFLRERKITGRTVLCLIAAAAPYALVAAGLMWYNTARFYNPLEFGQSYQLTAVDQTSYGSMLTMENLIKLPSGIFNALFVVSPIDTVFPYLRGGNGAFAVCPLLLFSFAFFAQRPRIWLKRERLFGFSVTVISAVILIVAFQIMWSPWLFDRYQSDYTYLLSVSAFCGVGACFALSQNRERLSGQICLASLACVILTALIFLVPIDQNYTDYDREALLRIWDFITLRAIR